MSLRTLKFGDRTISYDAGLDSLHFAQQEDASSNEDDAATEADGVNVNDDAGDSATESKICGDHYDDGIGSSDDETLTSSSSSSDASEKNSKEHDAGGAAADTADTAAAVGFESDSSPNHRLRRKVIRPDKMAIDQLLAFDEEEEDDLEEDDDSGDDGSTGGGDQSTKKSSHNSGWHKTIARDLANLSPSSNAKSSPSSALQRRHSITLCQSDRKRSAASRKSSASSSTSSDSPSPPTRRLSTATVASSAAPQSMMATSCQYELNVSEMHASLQTELESAQPWAARAAPDDMLRTLSLGLDEVAHIRSVLTRAELEGLPIDGSVRENVEKGKVCFLCMKTRFGLFSRGVKCEMCKQVVCHRCHTQMRIPVEHFNNTPVYALAPTKPNEASGAPAPAANETNQSLSPQPTILQKKTSLPSSLGLLESRSVGSAPSSPSANRKLDGGAAVEPAEEARERQVAASAVPTISAGLVTAEPAPSAGFGPVSLPMGSGTTSRIAKYATLPKKNRRMSLMSSKERERLEGSLLTVCSDCKDMVVQVIRTSRTTRRMQMVRSMFLNLSPDSVREHRL